MLPRYRNFDLSIDKIAAGYRARVTASPVGQASAEFALPFDAAQLAQPLDLLGGIVRGARPPAAGGPPAQVLAPDALGRQLYAAALAGPVHTCLARSLDAVRRDNERLRVRLNLAGVPELARLPWELLYAAEFDRFLALSPDTPVVRYLDLGEPEALWAVTPPLRVLAVVADPEDVAPRLDVAREWQIVQETLAPLVDAGTVVLERLPAATGEALQAALRRGDVHVLHFVGHGWFDAATDAGGLVMEDGNRRGWRMPAAAWGVLLQGHRALRLVFLNACQGAETADDDAFRGTAQHLVRQGVPAVVAMQFAITDRAAVHLSGAFYEALADGYPIDAALTEARRALFIGGSLVEWGTPVLFSRSPDNQLLPPLPARPSATPEQAEARLDYEPETVLVPAGAFCMGDRDAAEPWKQHSVTLPAYRVGIYPVTNAQYAEFVRSHPAHRPMQAGWAYTEPPRDRLDHPVVGIGWADAQAYCRWLSEVTGRGYRLPSEAEWEKAARGAGDDRAYPWGDEPPSPDRCNMGSGGTVPIGGFDAGKNPYGCHDMAGNVREWTSTAWGSHPLRPAFTYPYKVDGRENPDAARQPHRICRGGAYNDVPELLKVSARLPSHVDARLPTTGFRVARGT